MTPNELIGLADRDLDPTEQEARDALIASDPEARADAALAGELREHLDEEASGGPSLQDVRRAARPSSRWGLRAAVLLAASALIWFGLPTEGPVRDRGAGAVEARAQLSAIAEGPSGLRELAPGDTVHPDEQVVFWIDTSARGTVRLLEDGAPIYPTAGETWLVDPGSRALGGTAPMAWRADTPGAHRYTLELCVQPEQCVTTALPLEWTAR